jgi:hypothetical protein
MGKISPFLDLLFPILMVTSVGKVDSLLDKEAKNEVFPKLSVYSLPSDGNLIEQYHDDGSELMDLKQSKKSFASFRIRPKSDWI